jgi:hypothetical protein
MAEGLGMPADYFDDALREVSVRRNDALRPRPKRDTTRI